MLYSGGLGCGGLGSGGPDCPVDGTPGELGRRCFATGRRRGVAEDLRATTRLQSPEHAVDLGPLHGLAVEQELDEAIERTPLSAQCRQGAVLGIGQQESMILCDATQPISNHAYPCLIQLQSHGASCGGAKGAGARAWWPSTPQWRTGING